MVENTLKTAIVLDTNFIIENKEKFGDIKTNLSENFDVYITEISIKERKSQKYLEIKEIYSLLEQYKNDYSTYATISFKKTFEQMIEHINNRTNKTYETQFKNRVIAFNSNDDTLSEVLDRVHKKIPPFSTAKGSSDKGFKDTLMWMSIIQFFQHNSHGVNIIFITNDKCFIDNADCLKYEFSQATHKDIEIKDNNYYKILLGEPKESATREEKAIKELTLSEKRDLRERVSNAIESICHIETYDYDGNEWWEKTFIIGRSLEPTEIQKVFEGLTDVLQNHIFEKNIKASVIFEDITEVIDKNSILIEALEEVHELYNIIKTKYSDYLMPFLSSACEIINRNYESFGLHSDNDDDLPF